MSEHTPGPWRVVGDEPFEAELVDAHGHRVPGVKLWLDDADVTANQLLDANHRLLSRAPELLAEVERLRAEVDAARGEARVNAERVKQYSDDWGRDIDEAEREIAVAKDERDAARREAEAARERAERLCANLEHGPARLDSPQEVWAWARALAAATRAHLATHTQPGEPATVPPNSDKLDTPPELATGGPEGGEDQRGPVTPAPLAAPPGSAPPEKGTGGIADLEAAFGPFAPPRTTTSNSTAPPPLDGAGALTCWYCSKPATYVCPCHDRPYCVDHTGRKPPPAAPPAAEDNHNHVIAQALECVAKAVREAQHGDFVSAALLTSELRAAARRLTP